MFGIGDPDAGEVFHELASQSSVGFNAGWEQAFYLAENEEGGEAAENVISSNQLV